MLHLNRTNGKAGHCACCGRPLAKGEGLAYKFDGNTVGILCGNCLDGEIPVGVKAHKTHTPYSEADSLRPGDPVRPGSHRLAEYTFRLAVHFTGIRHDGL